MVSLKAFWRKKPLHGLRIFLCTAAALTAAGFICAASGSSVPWPTAEDYAQDLGLARGGKPSGAPASISDVSNSKVRIGLIDTAGTVDARQRLPLETYLSEFLTEISRNTLWSYSIIYVSRDEGYQMLKNGEIDLLGPVYPSKRDLSEYSVTVPGTGYSMLSLYALSSRQDLNIYDASTMNGLKVGCIWRDENLLGELGHYSEANGWNFTFAPYPDYQTLTAALRSGEVDAIVDDGTHLMPFFSRRVDVIEPVPASLLALKSASGLTARVNAAVYRTRITNPNFVSWLLMRYVDKATTSSARYTEAENSYLRRAGPLRAMFIGDSAPFAVQNKQEFKGLLPDILNALNVSSGLKFEIEHVPDFARMRGISGDQTSVYFDVLSDISHVPRDTRTTSVVHTLNFSLVSVSGRALPSFPVVAVPRYFHSLGDYISKNQPLWKVLSLPDEKLGYIDVCEGKADAVLVPRFDLQEYKLLTEYPKPLAPGPQEVQVPLRLFVTGPDAYLAGETLDVAIRKLSQESLFRSEYSRGEPDYSVRYFLSRHVVPALGVLFAVLVIIGAAVFTLHSSRMQARQNRVLTAKNNELRRIISEARELKASRDSYRIEAVQDVLTGMLNKRGLISEAERRFKTTAPHQTDALLVMDMDAFKSINDTMGHQTGDLALQRAAAVIRKVCHPEDLTARFGGDEFVICTQCLSSKNEIFHLAQKIQRGLSDCMADHGIKTVTASIGAALRPQDGSGYDELFKTADASLYLVKQAGGNGVSLSKGSVAPGPVRTPPRPDR